MAGLSEDTTEFSVADFATHSVGYLVAAGTFQKIGWCECWCTRAIHAERIGGETAEPSNHHTSAMERTSDSRWESEQMDCSRAGLTVDCHFGTFASQRQNVGRCRDCSGENPGFHEREIGQHLILGGDFNASFYGLTDFPSRGRVDTKTENSDGHKRYLARTSMTRC